MRLATRILQQGRTNMEQPPPRNRRITDIVRRQLQRWKRTVRVHRPVDITSLATGETITITKLPDDGLEAELPPGWTARLRERP